MHDVCAGNIWWPVIFVLDQITMPTTLCSAVDYTLCADIQLSGKKYIKYDKLRELLQQL